jgi:glutaredoxin
MGSESPPSLGPGRRCARHGLAAAPDGFCALCRSESLPPPRPYPTWVLGGLLAAIVLVSGVVVAYRAATSLAHAAAIAREPAPSRAAELPAQTPALAVPAAPSPGEAEAVPHQGESIPFDEPVPPPAAPALADTPPPPPAAAAASAAPPPLVPSRPPPTAAELQTALTTTPIVMYTASWCGVCRKARQFLSANGLRYQEIDVDESPTGWSKVQQLAGRRAVPVIVVDDKVMLGLDPDGIMRSVARSMERRLGITGITFKSR